MEIHNKDYSRHLHRFSLLLLFVGFCFMFVKTAFTQIINVKQDGSGDFTVIQEAVNGSANGDTILVFPGIYYENVDLTDKGIVLASTWMISHNDSLISQTIIDGNHQGSCIRSDSGNYKTEVTGFTLQHGTGTKYLEDFYPWRYGFGGGFYIYESDFIVSNCIIVNNFGSAGGGIQLIFSNLELVGSTIANNWSARKGGGISSSYSKIVFDSIHLNNVYLNFSSSGSDIAVTFSDTVQKIWLDTCTVINPDPYYIGNFNNRGIHIDRPPISVLHGKLEQMNADLYVNSTGDDANTGLTADNPLKTISFALLKIASDSINAKTVHVADGVYSNSLTGEHVPLQLKNYVNLVGQSRENTIIDCENKYKGARFAFGQDFSLVKNMSFNNGNGYYVGWEGGISTGFSKKFILDSIAFINTTGDYTVAIYSDSDDTLIMKNSIIKNCTGYKGIDIFVSNNVPPRYVELISNQFTRNYPDTSWNTKQLTIALSGSMNAPGQIYAKIINCLFDKNSDSVALVPIPVGIAVAASYQTFVSVANCTFADNTTTNVLGGPLQLSRSHAEVYNSIFYGNVPNQIVMADTPEEPSTLDIHHCLIQDGQGGVVNFGGSNIVEWGEGNLDEAPVFLGTEQFPYAIDFGSPCIDAGTLDLPPWIELPEYDLAGNPRVWGASVDMGAYEYGPWVSIKENPNSKFNPPVGGQNSKFLEVSPNPFTNGTYISYELKSDGRLNISVYSIAGLKVKTLVNHTCSVGDKGNFYWDGEDQDIQALPPGVYLIRMTIDGKEVETVKIVKREG